jgi:hypothetical protein
MDDGLLIKTSLIILVIFLFIVIVIVIAALTESHHQTTEFQIVYIDAATNRNGKTIIPKITVRYVGEKEEDSLSTIVQFLSISEQLPATIPWNEIAQRMSNAVYSIHKITGVSVQLVLDENVRITHTEGRILPL